MGSAADTGKASYGLSALLHLQFLFLVSSPHHLLSLSALARLVQSPGHMRQQVGNEHVV